MARALEGERPEAYVGSAEHLRDLDRLLVLAPEPIRAPLHTLRDFLSSGAVASDEETNLAEAWPPAVQDAVVAIRRYISTHC